MKICVQLKGNMQVNPTLVSRTGDTAYILTVINKTNPHMFYVDGINAHTKILRYGQNDTITIYSNKEGTYNYYDRLDDTSTNNSINNNGVKIMSLGQFKAVKIGGD
jgi:hypothetical protein